MCLLRPLISLSVNAQDIGSPGEHIGKEIVVTETALLESFINGLASSRQKVDSSPRNGPTLAGVVAPYIFSCFFNNYQRVYSTVVT